jgi:hypothetical protein
MRSNMMKRKVKTLAKLPRFKTDSRAEQFVANRDLARFEFAPK